MSRCGHRALDRHEAEPARAVDESVGTPDSVLARRFRPASDGHPSRPAIAGRLQRSTRRLGRAALERLLSELAPGGVYRADLVTQAAGGLLHHRFTLTSSAYWASQRFG